MSPIGRPDASAHAPHKSFVTVLPYCIKRKEKREERKVRGEKREEKRKKREMGLEGRNERERARKILTTDKYYTHKKTSLSGLSPSSFSYIYFDRIYSPKGVRRHLLLQRRVCRANVTRGDGTAELPERSPNLHGEIQGVCVCVRVMFFCACNICQL